MKSIMLALLMVGFLSLGAGRFVFAEETPVDTKTTAEAVKPVDVGNKICPVSGDKIDPAAKATYEYQGKIYNFCCSMCIEDFKKDPEKYIKKVEEELKGQANKSETTEKTESETTEKMEHHHEHMR